MLKPYEEKLKNIKKDTEEIGLLIFNSLELLLKELKNKNINKLTNISIGANKISSKLLKINNMIIKTLALYSPEAKDLRRLIAFLKITNELERVASNSKDFIKLFKKYYSKELSSETILQYSISLLEFAIYCFKTSIFIIYEKNEKEIDIMFQQVRIEEKKSDDLYWVAEKNILKFISKDSKYSKDYFNLLISLKKLEKICDRGVCIGKLLKFAQIGK